MVIKDLQKPTLPQIKLNDISFGPCFIIFFLVKSIFFEIGSYEGVSFFLLSLYLIFQCSVWMFPFVNFMILQGHSQNGCHGTSWGFPTDTRHPSCYWLLTTVIKKGIHSYRCDINLRCASRLLLNWCACLCPSVLRYDFNYLFSPSDIIGQFRK